MSGTHSGKEKEQAGSFADNAGKEDERMDFADGLCCQSSLFKAEITDVTAGGI